MTSKPLLLPTESEFDEWRSHSVTAALFTLLDARVADLKDQWASGQFTDMSQFGTAILNAKALGNCEACSLVRELTFEQLIGEIEDDFEFKRAQTSGSSDTGSAL